MIARRIPFVARLEVPVLGVTTRKGEYLEGEAGWGERSPLASWGISDQQHANDAAIEAATQLFPDPLRERFEVNAMIPRVSPSVAAQLAVASGCGTIKIKVGDAAGIERVAAVRAAVGARIKIRLDANAAWTTVDTAVDAIRRFERFAIELVEDPIDTIEELAWVRGEVSTPIAAESCVRTLDDVDAVVAAGAADALVLKPQRFGGVRACLRAAERFGGPVIASSALETSVGLAAVAALAAALPDTPYAHGVGTALLLRDDPSETRLTPIGGWMTPRRIAPAGDLLDPRRKTRL